MQQTRHLYILKGILSISDIALISITLFVSQFFTKGLDLIVLDEFTYRKHVMISALIWLLATNLTRLYNIDKISQNNIFNRSTLFSSVIHLLLLGIYFFLTHDTFPFYYYSGIISLIGPGFILSRFTATYIDETLLTNYKFRKPVAILGNNKGGIKFASYLKQQKNIQFHGFLDCERENLFEQAIKLGIKDIYVSLQPSELGDFSGLVAEAEKQCVRVKMIPDFYSLDSNRINNMGSFTVLSHRNEPLEILENRFIKRLFDIAFSSMVIIFILSWLYPILAILIKLQSSGPVLFKQSRNGRNNQPFLCYKFRSMKLNHASDTKQATRDDNRVTRIGKFMRKTSLDEFPQFFNVLFGDMSIVGPRPHMIQHTENYRALIEKYMVRQFLKPGITGWAQVNGFRGETRDTDMMRQRIEHDIWYMENWSETLDAKIVVMTITNLIKGEENAW